MYVQKYRYLFQTIRIFLNSKMYIFLQISEVETFCMGKQTESFFLKGRGTSFIFTEPPSI